MFRFEEEDSLYDWMSCLMPNHLYFGPFPNQRMIDRLHEEGFNVILNLTIPGEEQMYYLHEGMEYLSYPIPDNRYPLCVMSYATLVTHIKYLAMTKKIYVHCRGGHGRSGMTCVSIIYAIYPFDLRESIAFVNQSHNERNMLRNKWKKRNSPFNYDQFTFLSKIHKNIYINMNHPNKYYSWLYPCITKTNLFEIYQKNQSLSELYDALRRYVDENDVKDKLYLTNLKKFVMADCEDVVFCEWYAAIIWQIREFLFYFDAYDKCLI